MNRPAVTILLAVLAVMALASTVLARDASVPEDSEERLTLVVQGMAKSRSGAT